MGENTSSYQVELEFSGTQTYAQLLVELLFEKIGEGNVFTPPGQTQA